MISFLKWLFCLDDIPRKHLKVQIREQLWRIEHRLVKIEKSIEVIEGILSSQNEATSLAFYTTINGIERKVEKMDLKVDMSLPMSVKAVDKFGNPTSALDTVPVWTLSDVDAGDLTVAADGLSATLIPKGKLGAFDVVATAGALSGLLNINAIAGSAVSLAIEAGTPV